MFDSIFKVATSLLGPKSRSPDAQADANVDYQREFAKHGVRWKVEDAKAAGIHPLFALGADTASYTPNPIYSNASDVSSMGQDISRAIDSTRTRPERRDARLEALALERGQLENDLLRSQIARLNQQSSPPMPSPSSQPIVDAQPFEVTRTNPGSPHAEPAPVTEYGYSHTPDRGLAPVMSKEVKDRNEDDFVAEAMWHLRNTIIPNIPLVGASALRARQPTLDPGRGYHWEWSRATQQWKRVRNAYKGATGGELPAPGQTKHY